MLQDRHFNSYILISVVCGQYLLFIKERQWVTVPEVPNRSLSHRARLRNEMERQRRSTASSQSSAKLSFLSAFLLFVLRKLC